MKKEAAIIFVFALIVYPMIVVATYYTQLYPKLCDIPIKGGISATAQAP